MTAVAEPSISARLATIIQNASASGVDGWSHVAARDVLALVAAELTGPLTALERQHAADMQELRQLASRAPSDRASHRLRVVREIRDLVRTSLGGAR